MTVIFENKHKGNQIQHEGVKFFTTDAECLGVKGFSLHFEDGTFCMVNKAVFKLIMVKA